MSGIGAERMIGLVLVLGGLACFGWVALVAWWGNRS